MSHPPTPETILQNALEIHGADERAVYLDQACAGDSVLRDEVESLIACHLEAEAFMEPIVDSAWRGVCGERPGEMIGRYKLLELIGEGGFGTWPLPRQVLCRLAFDRL